jgi:hypothetical protein
MEMLCLLIAIIIGFMMLLYSVAERLPVSPAMRWVTWLLILPAFILPPILLITGMQREEDKIDLFLIISALSALSIGFGAALAFRIGQLQKEYRWIGIAGVVVAPIYAFFTFALAVAASFAD